MLVLVQEDRRASNLNTQLLDALLIVHGQQEGLDAGLGFDGHEDGEILREDSSWILKRFICSPILGCLWDVVKNFHVQ